MITLHESEFKKKFLSSGGKKHWWGFPRGFKWQNEIYVNKDAFFLNKSDYRLLIAHEEGHLCSRPHTATLTEKYLGKDHTWLGLMSPWGPVRYLTTSKVNSDNS